jgi:Tol biopolymer transport system component
MKDSTEASLCPDDDGIWRVNLNTGEASLVLSISEVAKQSPQPDMHSAQHYFNHALFNPDGTRFVCLHIWSRGDARRMRMFTCRPDGTDFYLLTNENHVSHYSWKSSDELLAFSSHADLGTHFYLYKDKSNVRSIFAPELLKQDGHPSFSPDGKSLLVDHYPDKYGDQCLFLIDSELRMSKLNGFDTNGSLNGEFRCDLHSRWDREGRKICIDSAHNGRRGLYVIDLGTQGI